MPKPDSARTQISANVPPDVRAAVDARAEQEDRPPAFVLRRAIRLYLSLPVDEAERLLREGTPAP